MLDALLLLGLIACLTVCVTVLALAAPLLLILRLVTPLLPLRWRSGARFVLVAAVYLATFECGVLADVISLRIRHPRLAPEDADRHCARHENVLARRTAAFFGPGLRLAGVKSPPIPPPPGLRPDRPVVILARHAGFANAQLTAHLVSNILARRPKAIAKRAICSDPGFGAALTHMNIHTFRWSSQGRVKALAKLTGMARAARPEEGFILFPEGTNFTAGRRRDAIARLRERGKHLRADEADALPHTMPPIVTGAKALISSAPDADVVVFGHTGLEDLLAWCVDTTPGSAGSTFHTMTWHVAAEDVPRDDPGFEQWLCGIWRELDSWVASVRGTAADEDDPSLTITIAGNRQRARKTPSRRPNRSRYGL